MLCVVVLINSDNRDLILIPTFLFRLLFTRVPDIPVFLLIFRAGRLPYWQDLFV
jgi:hypothetical protein